APPPHPGRWGGPSGNLVQPFKEGNESAFAAELLEKSVVMACTAEVDALPGAARTELIRALAAEPMNRAGLVLERSLQVNLSNGKGYPAELKYYSPPAYEVTAGGRGRGRPGRRHLEDRRARAAGSAPRPPEHRSPPGPGAVRHRVPGRGGRPRAPEPGPPIRALDHHRTRVGVQGGCGRPARDPDRRRHHPGQ